MRLLTIIVLALAALYSAYWVTGRYAVTRGTDTVLTDLRDAGWTVETTDISTRGYPSRFDTTATDIALTTPDGAVTWTAPFVQVFALSYAPTRIIAAFPPEQTLALPGLTLRLSADGLRASAATRPTPDLPLSEAIVESGPLTLAADIGGTLTATRALMALRATDAPARYDVFAELTGIVPPALVTAPLTAGTDLPDTLDALRLDGTVTLDAPLDRHAAAARPTALTLRDASLRWGPARLALSGALTFDTAGRASGTLTLDADALPALIGLATNARLIDPDAAPGILATIAGIADGDTLTAPITISDGVASIGFVPLGTIPPLP